MTIIMIMNTIMTNEKYHLITIVFSHYNEKARWGLDYFGIPYTESAYLPLVRLGLKKGLHINPHSQKKSLAAIQPVNKSLQAISIRL